MDLYHGTLYSILVKQQNDVKYHKTMLINKYKICFQQFIMAIKRAGCMYFFNIKFKHLTILRLTFIVGFKFKAYDCYFFH